VYYQNQENPRQDFMQYLTFIQNNVFAYYLKTTWFLLHIPEINKTWKGVAVEVWGGNRLYFGVTIFATDINIKNNYCCRNSLSFNFLFFS